MIGYKKKTTTTEEYLIRQRPNACANFEINISQYNKTTEQLERDSHVEDHSCNAKNSSIGEIPMVASQKYWTKNQVDEQVKINEL